MSTSESPRDRAEETSGIVHDASIESAESATSGAASLFDLRNVIGALFTLYGIVLIVYGFFDSAADIEKAAGIRINLWTGLGMLVTGLVFLAWARLRPLRTEEILEATKAGEDDEHADLLAERPGEQRPE